MLGGHKRFHSTSAQHVQNLERHATSTHLHGSNGNGALEARGGALQVRTSMPREATTSKDCEAGKPAKAFIGRW